MLLNRNARLVTAVHALAFLQHGAEHRQAQDSNRLQYQSIQEVMSSRDTCQISNSSKICASVPLLPSTNLVHCCSQQAAFGLEQTVIVQQAARLGRIELRQQVAQERNCS